MGMKAGVCLETQEYAKHLAQQVTSERLSVADRHTWCQSCFGQGVPFHEEDVMQEENMQ